MIRAFACPSLVCLQIKYAQTYVEGRAFVRDVLGRMPVEELVGLPLIYIDRAVLMY